MEECFEIFRVSEFINHWRLATAAEGRGNFQKVISFFNLSEFTDFDETSLISNNKTLYLKLYLIPSSAGSNYTFSPPEVFTNRSKGTIFYQMLRLAVDELFALYNNNKQDKFFIAESLNTYIMSVRKKEDFLPQDDRRLINSKSPDSCNALCKIRNYIGELNNIEDYDVCLTVVLEDNSY